MLLVFVVAAAHSARTIHTFAVDLNRTERLFDDEICSNRGTRCGYRDRHVTGGDRNDGKFITQCHTDKKKNTPHTKELLYNNTFLN